MPGMRQRGVKFECDTGMRYRCVYVCVCVCVLWEYKKEVITSVTLMFNSETWNCPLNGLVNLEGVGCGYKFKVLLHSLTVLVPFKQDRRPE